MAEEPGEGLDGCLWRFAPGSLVMVAIAGDDGTTVGEVGVVGVAGERLISRVVLARPKASGCLESLFGTR